MLGFLPTRAYRPGTPGATTFLSPLSGTFNYGWDSFRPGPGYWRNHALYDVSADLDPTTARITGSETIVYQNNSPDILDLLVLHLHMNLHKSEAVRNEPEEITEGMVLRSVTVDGASGSWTTRGTLLLVRPPSPIPSGGTTTIAIDWEEILPQSSSGRVGWSDREVYFGACQRQ